MLQSVAVCCSVLQCVAVLQSVAECCRESRYIAMTVLAQNTEMYSLVHVLQCVAVRRVAVCRSVS